MKSADKMEDGNLEGQPIDTEVDAWIMEYTKNEKDREGRWSIANQLRNRALEIRPERYKQYFRTMWENDTSATFIPEHVVFEYCAAPLEKNLHLPPQIASKVFDEEKIKNLKRNEAGDIMLNDAEDIKAYRLYDIDRLIGEWLIFKNTYDRIDMAKQDENTGRAILEEMKRAVEEFHPLFIDFIAKVREAISSNVDVTSVPSARLLELSRKMHELAGEYGDLPAYQAYRHFRYMEIESDLSSIVASGKPTTRYEWLLAGKPVKFKT